MNHLKPSTSAKSKMKATAYLIVAALITPVALAFGASAALTATAATGIALSSIALGDYGKSTCSYDRAAAKRAERHPLAA